MQNDGMSDLNDLDTVTTKNVLVVVFPGEQRFDDLVKIFEKVYTLNLFIFLERALVFFGKKHNFQRNKERTRR